MSSQLPVNYIEAGSVERAIELLAGDPETQIVASGYSLVPLLKDGIETPDRLVDISGIDALGGISRRDGTTAIGALTTHDRIAASRPVREHARALAEATDSVGDYQAKHQGTIGGNLAFADPKYDAPAAVLALDATVVTQGPDGQRRIGAEEWFRGPSETVIRPDELITELVVPDAKQSGYVRSSAYSGYAIVSVAVALKTDGGRVDSARVAVNGAKPYPIRLPHVEEALIGESLEADLRAQAAEVALRDVDPDTLVSSEAADGEHRLRLARSQCQEALERASMAPTTKQ
jgi:carbon-monoxide dehydrogenase medium subunit